MRMSACRSTYTAPMCRCFRRCAGEFGGWPRVHSTADLDGSLDADSASIDFGPVACIDSGGAKGIRTPDLLDANESTWAFAASSCDGCAMKLQVSGLVVAAAGNHRKLWCVPSVYRMCTRPPGRRR